LNTITKDDLQAATLLLFLMVDGDLVLGAENFEAVREVIRKKYPDIPNYVASKFDNIDQKQLLDVVTKELTRLLNKQKKEISKEAGIAE
jgi:uncharacterized protein with HEPN domain